MKIINDHRDNGVTNLFHQCEFRKFIFDEPNSVDTNTTMTNTAAIRQANTTIIRNPYKKITKDVTRVSLSPNTRFLTQHKSWLEEGGQRQPPPAHEVCCEKERGEERAIAKNEDLHKENTEILHGDHGVFLVKKDGVVFLVIPCHDEFCVPDFQETFEKAASVPDCEVTSKNTTNEERTSRLTKVITKEAGELAKVTTNIYNNNDNPQWAKSTFPNIPVMSDICKLLCEELEAIRFLANRGVIDPCGICKNCNGK